MKVSGNRGGLVQKTEWCGSYRVECLSSDPLQYAQYRYPNTDHKMMMEKHEAKSQHFQVSKLPENKSKKSKD